jgi:hypothetical protein
VAPDVFVVKGVAKHIRDNYLVWQEGKGPDIAIEFTSKTTQEEDLESKFAIYEQKLRVPEYFLFDPKCEYLDPPFQGYRLRGGKYVAIRPVKGRLPSQVLGLHLERQGVHLRFFDPTPGRWLLTANERLALAEAGRVQAEAENERLQRELAELKRKLNGNGLQGHR